MTKSSLSLHFEGAGTPSQAVDRLAELYAEATTALRAAVEKFLVDGEPPDAAVRARFRYPELRVTYNPDAVPPSSARAFAKFSEPGVYSTTVTQPEDFRHYLLEQLEPLVKEFGATIEVGVGGQEIPYPYVFESGDELGRGGATAAELARFFPVPSLAVVGDEIADGAFEIRPGFERPIALFDAARVDYSLRRLVHYTGSDWRDDAALGAADQLPPLRRPVRALGPRAVAKRVGLPAGDAGQRRHRRRRDAEEAEARAAAVLWHRFQMPAYHVVRADGRGVSLVNIGVGPANAKTITDHIAVLRPHCWLMVGHCAGLRQSQRIGDYVLAHAYLRQDKILDAPCRSICRFRRWPKCRSRCRRRWRNVTGDRGEALKRRLRTGTVVTNDDRNWELRWTQERRRINLSRAIAVDMESATIATQGFRMRVPYGTLLCVSDKPLHGEIKLPGAANAFYERAIGEHLHIGIAALELLQKERPRCTRASCAASTSRRSGDSPSPAKREKSLPGRRPEGAAKRQMRARELPSPEPSPASGRGGLTPRTPGRSTPPAAPPSSN